MEEYSVGSYSGEMSAKARVYSDLAYDYGTPKRLYPNATPFAKLYFKKLGVRLYARVPNMITRGTQTALCGTVTEDQNLNTLTALQAPQTVDHRPFAHSQRRSPEDIYDENRRSYLEHVDPQHMEEVKLEPTDDTVMDGSD
jgi:hypothetical protein